MLRCGRAASLGTSSTHQVGDEETLLAASFAPSRRQDEDEQRHSRDGQSHEDGIPDAFYSPMPSDGRVRVLHRHNLGL